MILKALFFCFLAFTIDGEIFDDYLLLILW